MEIRIVLTLWAMLFLATFFEVDSMSSSETSSESSTFPSEVLSSYQAESSSRGSRRGEESVRESTDHAESSSRSSRKGKKPVEARPLEEVKAELKKLYEQLSFGRDMLWRDIRRGEYDFLIAIARKNLKEIEQEIIALRPELRKARGMKNSKNSKKAMRKIDEAIKKLQERIQNNDAELKELQEKGDTGKRYKKLMRKQNINRANLENMKDASYRHGLKIHHFLYPELVDGDIVPPGFNMPQ